MFFPKESTRKSIGKQNVIPKFSILCWQSHFSWNYKNYNLFQSHMYFLGKSMTYQKLFCITNKFFNNSGRS